MQDHHLQSLEHLEFVQTYFGPFDLGSSQNKMGNWHGFQQKSSYNFSLNQNQLMLCKNLLNVV
jgi:hypothetical protein